MTIEFVFKKLIEIYFFAIARKKIFFIWLLIYLLGLSAIYFYKINNYEIKFKIKFFGEFPTTNRMFDNGIDAMMYKFKNDYMKDERPTIVNEVFHFHIKGKSKEEIIDKVKIINSKVDILKDEVTNLIVKINESLEDELNTILLTNNQTEIDNFFDWYFKQKFQDKLFLEIYKDYYVHNEFYKNDIKNIDVALIIKSFSLYILVLYLFNLIILIFHKYKP